jgi:hypothetical protein
LKYHSISDSACRACTRLIRSARVPGFRFRVTPNSSIRSKSTSVTHYSAVRSSGPFCVSAVLNHPPLRCRIAHTIWSRVTRPSRLALSRAPPVSRSAYCPCSRFRRLQRHHIRWPRRSSIDKTRIPARLIGGKQWRPLFVSGNNHCSWHL